MSCMFRIAGANLDIDRLLAAVSLPATMSFKKGEPRLKTRPRGQKNRTSGAAFVVSNADFDNFEKQKKDAVTFLRSKRTAIRRIMKWPGVEAGDLDFGLEQREVMVQCEQLPAELLRLVGGLGLDIELSLYPQWEWDRRGERVRRKKAKKPTRPRNLAR